MSWSIAGVSFVVSACTGLAAIVAAFVSWTVHEKAALGTRLVRTSLGLLPGMVWSIQGAYAAIVQKHPSPTSSVGAVLYPLIILGGYVIHSSCRAVGAGLRHPLRKLALAAQVIAWWVGVGVATASCVYV